MFKIFNALKIWSLRKALQKNAPDRIPTSRGSCERNNFYSIIIMVNGLKHIAESIDGDNLMTVKYNKNSGRVDIEDCLRLDEIELSSIKIKHYLKCNEKTYKGLNKFAFDYITKRFHFIAFFNNTTDGIKQFIYNTKQLEMKNRHELLHYLIRVYGFNEAEFSIYMLMSRQYTERIFYHPNRNEYHDALKLYIDSLISSGEVVSVKNGFYALSGKALVTLEKYQIEERRHRDAHYTQLGTLFLTFVLAFLASIQAGLIKLAPIIDLTQ